MFPAEEIRAVEEGGAEGGGAVNRCRFQRLSNSSVHLDELKTTVH
jgi:hypothetical protein